MTRGRALVLGGTRFVGRHLTDALLASGWEVTLFNRGVTAPGEFDGVGFNLFSTGVALVMLARQLSPEKLAAMFPDPRAATVSASEDPALGEAAQAERREEPGGTAGAAPIPPQATA